MRGRLWSGLFPRSTLYARLAYRRFWWSESGWEGFFRRSRYQEYNCFPGFSWLLELLNLLFPVQDMLRLRELFLRWSEYPGKRLCATMMLSRRLFSTLARPLF